MGQEKQNMSNDSAPPTDLRAALGRLGVGITKHRGERLFEQGKVATGIYLIRRGRVALLVEKSDKRACTQVVGAGALIGLPAVMASNRFSVTAEVLDDCDLVFIPRGIVVKTLSHSTELCIQALDVLGREVQEMRRVLGAAAYTAN
jgi:CRP-like cAMP-binding protein